MKMIELSQNIFLKWLEIVLSQSLESQINVNSNRNDNFTEKCYSTKILSKNINNLQITINVELVQILEKISHPIHVLCFSSKSSWQSKVLEPIANTKQYIIVSTSTVKTDKLSSGKGFSQAQIILISFCGTILALFFVVAIIMRIRNYLKRRTKLYRDTLSPGLPVIYQDFDLNPRSEERPRHYHHDTQWTRHVQQQHSYKREMNPQMKPASVQIVHCQDQCTFTRCKLSESIKVSSNPKNYSLRPLMNSCNLAELKRSMNNNNSKETVLETSFSGVPSAITKRRRHSLVDQIESVMNKHFDKSGVNKTWSNENLKRTRSNSKLPYRFRKAISLRRRLSIEELPRLEKKTQSYRHNINTIS